MRRQRCAGLRCALLLHQTSDVLAQVGSRSRLTCGRSLTQLALLTENTKPSSGQATKATILLFDGLLKHLWPELCQPSLKIATAQAASGRSTLQQCSLALLNLRLEERALLDLSDGRLLCLGAKHAGQSKLLLVRRLATLHKRLHPAQRRRARLDKRLEDTARDVELPTQLFDAGHCGCFLGARCLLCGLRLQRAADDLTSSIDKSRRAQTSPRSGSSPASSARSAGCTCTGCTSTGRTCAASQNGVNTGHFSRCSGGYDPRRHAFCNT